MRKRFVTHKYFGQPFWPALLSPAFRGGWKLGDPLLVKTGRLSRKRVECASGIAGAFSVLQVEGRELSRKSGGNSAAALHTLARLSFRVVGSTFQELKEQGLEL